MNLGAIHYAAGAPANYKCATCGAAGCKLWRDSYSFAPVQLLCCDCAGISQGRDVSDIDERGKLPSGTDQIGWLVPAVPTEDGTTFWGYCAVPAAGCDWWRRLTTRTGVPA